MAQNQPSVKDLNKYEKEYSEPKFWGKIGAVAKKAGEKVIYMALILFYVLKSSNVTAKNKALIIGALGYFILPIDLIPDAIPALGFTDDLAALTIAYNAIKSSVTPDIEEQANNKMAQWFT